MSNLLPKFHSFFLKLDKNVIRFIVVLLIALLGLLDYLTGFEISFSFFYLIPICIATWYIDIQTGYVITVVSVSVWMLSNWLAGEAYSHEAIRYWNMFARLSVFVMVAWLLNELKLALLHERRLSRIDPLTGISNRREFQDQAELELQLARRHKWPVSVAYMDIDLFKQVNDELGHRAGDRLLQVFTHAVARMIRKSDLFARLGGDEFVILFPQTDMGQAKRALDKLMPVVSAEITEIHPQATLSVGVVSFSSPPKTVDDLIQKADALMYEAKIQGRNKTHFLEVKN